MPMVTKREAPERGKELILDVTDMTDDGRGIAKTGGLVVFVSGCVVGDRMRARIGKVKKRYALATCLEILDPSPHRLPPTQSVEAAAGYTDEERLCPHQTVCGGCHYGLITYEKELELKENHLREKLERIGGVASANIAPIVAMQSPYRYRNKAQMQVSTGGNQMRKGGILENLGAPRVGFYAPRTHEVTDCPDCALQSEPAVAAARALRRFMEEDHISAWDERWGLGLLRHMVVRTAFGTGEVMVILVLNGKAVPNAPKLVDMLNEAISECGYDLESVYINIHKDNTSEIFGNEFIPLAGRKVIREQLGDLALEISPASFYQVNPAMTQVLYDKVKELVFAGRKTRPIILDLYCGVGTIGLWLADEAAQVVGIESVHAAVLDANRNATINGIVNARFITGKVEEVLPALDKEPKDASSCDEELLELVRGADTVILDPPRKGSHPALLAAVQRLAPERIIYVSCDPATLARDIAILTGKDRNVSTEVASEDVTGIPYTRYRVEEVAPFDMFPRTGHVECVVLLSRETK